MIAFYYTRHFFVAASLCHRNDKNLNDKKIQKVQKKNLESTKLPIKKPIIYSLPSVKYKIKYLSSRNTNVKRFSSDIMSLSNALWFQFFRCLDIV